MVTSLYTHTTGKPAGRFCSFQVHGHVGHVLTWVTCSRHEGGPGKEHIGVRDEKEKYNVIVTGERRKRAASRFYEAKAEPLREARGE